MRAPGRGLRPFFVCGSPKSGTTWLQRVLDAHPCIACAGEGHFIEQLMHPMMQVLRHYNAKLEQVSERVYQGDAPYPPLTDGEMVAAVRDLAIRLLRRQRLHDGVEWIGDKTPRYTDHLKELRLLFPGARFIHIVRDPRDVAVSRLFHAQRAGYADALTAGAETYYKLIGNAAKAWAIHNGNVDAFRRSGAAPIHEVSYENLLEGFEGHVAELFAFLDLDSSPRLLADIKQKTDFEAVSGRARGEENAASFFRKGVTGDWRGRLDDRALTIIDTHCRPMMDAKGYR